MTELKPCPKCKGGARTCVGPDLALSGNEWRAWVECLLCGFRGPDAAHSEVRAENSWNSLNRYGEGSIRKDSE